MRGAVGGDGRSKHYAQCRESPRDRSRIQVDPPHHINLLTRESLSDLMENAGFTIVEYSTLSTYIRAVREIENRGLLLRKIAFQALKSARLGADYFVICRPTEKIET